MPITVAKIANNTAETTFAVSADPTDTVTVTYYPGRVTERVFAAMQGFGKSNEDSLMADFAEFNKTLANLIQDWDVYEDEKQTIKFPVDPARFPDLPFAFRMQVVDAIMSDIRPEAGAPQTRN